MDRMEEYRTLLSGLERPPAALEGCVQRALARRRRERRARRAWTASFGSAAAVFALFVLLVNVSAPFAAACEGIPILKELAAAVSFSHSLSSAVDHGYVQNIGQIQTDNGVTVELDYMMLDGGQAVFFGRVTGPEGVERCQVRPEIRAQDGSGLEGFALMSGSIPVGELSTLFTLAINPEEFYFPEVLRITCYVELGQSPFHAPVRAPEGPQERPPDAAVSFEVPVDQELLNQRRTLPMDRQITLDGVPLRLTGLEFYPTFARFTLEQDEDSPMVLQTIGFYFTDEQGNCYESGSASGLSAMGDTYWFESPFFQDPEHLTLHITSASWLEKSRERTVIDLNTGAARSPLPEGVRSAVRREGNGFQVALTAPLGKGSTEDHHIFYQLFGHHYYAPDGTQYEINQISSTIGSPWHDGDEIAYEGLFSECITLQGWPWDTVEAELYLTRRAEYAEPIEIPLY